ncbi:hypothetical protein EVAR_31249_1 [Eumeta japonica]|uniref:Uncharacterized protein n=1 Tax=Eumeta variegata TaxID=151549 RepID=A0A4C1W2D7_EUMVA|nr:hypothetical protein EVAR_31249_1 [Eumeta japonica]
MFVSRSDSPFFCHKYCLTRKDSFIRYQSAYTGKLKDEHESWAASVGQIWEHVLKCPQEVLTLSRKTNAITKAAKLWRLGQLFGITCVTFQDETKINQFLLVYVVTSSMVALVSVIYAIGSILWWKPLDSATVAFLIDYFTAVATNVALSVGLNSGKSLKMLLKLIQTVDKKNIKLFQRK